MANHNRVGFQLLVLILASFLTASAQSCASQGRSTAIRNPTPQRRSTIVRPPDVKVCEAIYYNTPSEDSRCYKLQERLNEAAIKGDLAEMRQSIEEGANVEAGYDSSFRPLYIASMSGQTEAVALLIQAGADINRFENFGQTPLKAAVSYGFPEIVELLLKSGADVCLTKPDDSGKTETALDIATKKGFSDISRILAIAGANDCPN